MIWTRPIDLPDTSRIPRGGFVLESSERGDTGRWSVLAGAPRDLVSWRLGQGDPLALLREALASWPDPGASELPFVGGLVGYFGYELAAAFERLPVPERDPLGIPPVALGVHDGAVVVDHDAGTAWSVGVDSPFASAREAAARAADAVFAESFEKAEVVESKLLELPDRDAHERAVARIRDYIAAGDVYQVNLTGSLVAETHATPSALWCNLREAVAAPFTAALDFGEYAVLSASPERFLRVRGRDVETRPIKGTRPRGTRAADDARLVRELEASAKDRAELLMIVDLHRNDLGRVCDYGSVHVPTLFGVRTFPAVHHLEATIRGTLAPGYDALDVLEAAFPAGSITGAPKIRAMEIIAELEGSRRGAYCGAIGYLDVRGHLDLSVAIRTAVVRPPRVHYGAGGGIVWDSVPSAEYEELLVKCRPFAEMLGGLALGAVDEQADRRNLAE